MEIVYDEPIKVNRLRYELLMRQCRGLVAGRIDDNGNCWIKVWLEKEYVKQFLPQ